MEVKVILLFGVFLATGCYMTNLTTARTVGSGKVGLTGGMGVIPSPSVEHSSPEVSDRLYLLPQIRLDIVLGDSSTRKSSTCRCTSRSRPG